MRCRLLALAALLLSGCSDPDLDSAHKAIAGRVKDLLSLQYQNERASKYAVCVEYNAKNEMGGYVGFKKYVYVKSTYELMAQVDEIDDKNTDGMWRQTLADVSACVQQVPEALFLKRLHSFDERLKKLYDTWSKACERSNYALVEGCTSGADYGNEVYNYAVKLS